VEDEVPARTKVHTVKLYLVVLSVALSGCVTSTVMQLAGGPGPPSHKADRLLSAHRTADGDFVVFVKGRLHGVKGESEFSLLVPRAAVERLKIRRAEAKHDESVFNYDAPIGPSGAYMAEGWREIPIKKETTDVDRHTIPAASEAVFYELPSALGASNGKGLRAYWGDVRLMYVEPYEDQGTLRIDITPDAQRVEGNASKWLPLTIPADIVTLPIQAMWTSLFVVAMAGVATSEGNAAED
jgi:hypothetical protein